jgi:hypothetical protein
MSNGDICCKKDLRLLLTPKDLQGRSNRSRGLPIETPQMRGSYRMVKANLQYIYIFSPVLISGTRAHKYIISFI